MEPIDYRNATFEQVKANLQGLRADVLGALMKHGPCTTRELAQRSGMDLLRVRPRVTELIDLGLVVLDESQHEAPGRGKEGVYRALSEAEALTLFHALQDEARRSEQLHFPKA